MGYESQYILTIVGSFAFHMAIFEWLAYPLLRKLLPVSTTLPATEHVVLRSSLMSTFHAVIVAGIGLYMFLFHDDFNAEDLWFIPPLYLHAPCFSVGYLAADSLQMALNVTLQDWKMFLHHAISLCSAHNVMAGPAALYFLNTWFLTELSTPFVNMGVILNTLDHRRSLLYKVNGLTMLLVFFLCRIATIPIYFGVIPHMKTGEMYKIPPGILINIFVFSPIISVMNIFWFIKMCKMAYRVLRPSDKMNME